MFFFFFDKHRRKYYITDNIDYNLQSDLHPYSPGIGARECIFCSCQKFPYIYKHQRTNWIGTYINWPGLY